MADEPVIDFDLPPDCSLIQLVDGGPLSVPAVSRGGPRVLQTGQLWFMPNDELRDYEAGTGHKHWARYTPPGAAPAAPATPIEEAT